MIELSKGDDDDDEDDCSCHDESLSGLGEAVCVLSSQPRISWLRPYGGITVCVVTLKTAVTIVYKLHVYVLRVQTSCICTWCRNFIYHLTGCTLGVTPPSCKTRM
eukprot:GHVQ01025920.1.p1 GENE.GHVQ01025920.1~~GHVQ01025920.1.p1  ORF type:complete len:105 (-),score=17.51 GHVQ01025920.1:188-502(-)